MLRTGVIAKKLGMTRVYDDAGNHVPVTVLALEGCQVVAHKTQDRDGYVALQLGAGEAKVKRVSKAERERFAKAGVTPKMTLKEFRVDAGNEIEVGSVLEADHFVPGQKVEVFAQHTVCLSLTARTAQLASVRIRVRFSKVRKWPVTWARFVLRTKTSKWHVF